MNFNYMAAGSRHGWYERGTFFFLISLDLQQFKDDEFVVADGLVRKIAEQPADLEILAGRLTCQHSLFLDVQMKLDTTVRGGRIWVRLRTRQYHAGVLGKHPRPIFRYDNSHPYPGHPDAFHKHQFDPATWEQPDWPVWIGRENWPSLGDVLEELRQWWEVTGSHLDLTKGEA
ncbi:MAG: hypothetical protein QM692_21570 [Thermomicrobiales bacterium]